MSRPTVVNAKRQPIPPLNLEEWKFWLRIMEEHALFIQMGLPCENMGLINEAEGFAQQYSAFRAKAEKVQSENRFSELVNDSLRVTSDFHSYIRRLLHLTLTCRLNGSNFALFLDHLSREAEYFIRLLDKLASGQPPLYQIASAREVLFWLRLMADHTKFVVHKLDPAERSLVEMAGTYSEEFDELYLEGRDFASMLRGESEEVPSFRRFLQDVRVSTIRLRDFKRAAQMLIAECKLLGLIPEVLADHMRREADHLLLTLAILEKGPFVTYDDAQEYEYVNMDEQDNAVIKPEVMSEAFEPQSPPKCKKPKPTPMVQVETPMEVEREESFSVEPQAEENIIEMAVPTKPIIDVPVTEVSLQPEAQGSPSMDLPPYVPSKHVPENKLKLPQNPPKDQLKSKAHGGAKPSESGSKGKWSGKLPRPLGKE
ncbi:MAG: hypothetical protein H6Q75_881 [Firmicutes bacterium]|nr:hypothetical protein [Bacillota bacterium]